MRKNLRLAAFVALLLAAQALPSHALPVGFNTSPGLYTPYLEDVFKFDSVQVVSGNCAATRCLRLNRNEISTMTLAAGGTFSVSSFWFQLLSSNALLRVQSFSGATMLETLLFTSAGYPANNGGQVFNHLFAGATSISFQNIGRGSIRIDNIEGAPSPVAEVPLPSGLPLFLSGLVALGMVGRRKKPTK